MIRVHELTRRYGPVTAIDGLSFEVEPGETFALIGPNGAGKTTTLKCLLGLVRPDHGTIALGRQGLPPADPRGREVIGYVPQRVEFAPRRSVREVLGFVASLRGLAPACVDRALERVSMRDMAGRSASELSGGYAQRLSLATALLGEPELLVLDEPTASLDPQATHEFRSLVEELQADGCTILLCSHLLPEVERIADRVLILVRGRAAALERLDDLRERQARATRLRLRLAEPAERTRERLALRGLESSVVDHETLILEAGGDRTGDALECIRASGASILSLEVERPSLEDLFLEVVGERLTGAGS